MKRRLAFMGTPDFAVEALRAIHAAGHDIAMVYSQPPKPAGRGQHLQKTPVHQCAEQYGLPVRTPRSLRDAAEQQAFAALDLDVAVVAAYGLILPAPVLNAPRFGCLNIHASLLPRWRGAAPIQRAILAGDTESGVTIMQMDVGLDTGAMLLKDSVPITAETTAGSLHDALAARGSSLIAQALDNLGAMAPEPQAAEGVTYAAKLTREDGRLDWRKPAGDLARQVRGLQPWPGSFFMLGGEAIKVLAAESVAMNVAASTGTLLDADFTVACGQGALRLLRLQRAGKNATDGASLLRGLRLPVGQALP